MARQEVGLGLAGAVGVGAGVFLVEALVDLLGLGFTVPEQLAQGRLEGGDLVLILEGEDDAPAGLAQVLGIHAFLGAKVLLGDPLVPEFQLLDLGLVQCFVLCDLGDDVGRLRLQQVLACRAVDAVEVEKFTRHGRSPCLLRLRWDVHLAYTLNVPGCRFSHGGGPVMTDIR